MKFNFLLVKIIIANAFKIPYQLRFRYFWFNNTYSLDSFCDDKLKSQLSFSFLHQYNSSAATGSII